jgi:hypothetical protein
MPTTTYNLLQHTTVNTPVETVTFTGLDQSYRDLVLVVSMSVPSGSMLSGIQPNSDNLQNYETQLLSDGPYAYASSTGNYFFTGSTMSGDFMQTFQIFDYSQTNKYKFGLIRDSKGTGAVVAGSALWKSTDAITSIKYGQVGNGTNIPNGATFKLFGIVG